MVLETRDLRVEEELPKTQGSQCTGLVAGAWRSDTAELVSGWREHGGDFDFHVFLRVLRAAGGFELALFCGSSMRQVL